jgi:hypothetical protein
LREVIRHRGFAALVLACVLLAATASLIYASSGSYVPVQGARIVLRVPGTEGGDFVSKNVSDPGGSFRLGGVLFDGTYRINAGADGYTNGSVLVPLKGGANISGVIVRMNRSAILTGIVRSADGRTVVGALVCVLSDIYGCIAHDFTSSDGRYVLDTNITTGTYTVQVDPGVSQEFSSLTFPTSSYFTNSSGQAQFDPSPFPGSAPQLARNIVLTAGTVTELNMSLTPSAAVMGRITFTDGRPIAGAEVLVAASNDSVPSSLDNPYNLLGAHAFSNSSGYFRVTDGLPSGQYTVTVLPYPSPYGYIYTPYSQQRNVSLVAGQLADLNFSVPLSGVIEGHVLDSNGEPLRGVYVSASFNGSEHSPNNPSGFAFTNSTGGYSISDGLANGTYNVSVQTEYGVGVMTRVSGVQVTQGVKTRLDILSQAVQDTVRGVVLGNHGEPISGAVVALDEENSTFYPHGELGGITNSTGGYQVSFLSPPDATINVTTGAAGYKAASVTVNASRGGIIVANFDLQESGVNPTPQPPQGSVSGVVVGEEKATLDEPTRQYQLTVKAGAGELHFRVATNSHLYGLEVDTKDRSLQLSVRGPAGTNGSLDISVPTVFIPAPIGAAINGVQTVAPLVLAQNASFTTIRVSYLHVSPLNITLTSGSSYTTSSTSNTASSSSISRPAGIDYRVYIVVIAVVVAVFLMVFTVAKKNRGRSLWKSDEQMPRALKPNRSLGHYHRV